MSIQNKNGWCVSFFAGSTIDAVDMGVAIAVVYKILATVIHGKSVLEMDQNTDRRSNLA